MASKNGSPEYGTVTGPLQHTGSTVGLFGVTPTARPAAIVQTYSTADRTHAALTALNALTDNSAGASGGDTIASVDAGPIDTGAASLATTRNAIATLAERVNELRVDLLDLKQLMNSVIDDLQLLGVEQ